MPFPHSRHLRQASLPTDSGQEPKIPTQVIYAENTVKMSRETVDVIGQLNSQIAMVQIPGATHFFPITHQKDTAIAIADFANAVQRRHA